MLKLLSCWIYNAQSFMAGRSWFWNPPLQIMSRIYDAHLIKWHNTSFAVNDIKGLPIINMLDLKFSPRFVSRCVWNSGLWNLSASLDYVMTRLSYRCAAERRSILLAWNLKLGWYMSLSPRTCPGGLHAAPRTRPETSTEAVVRVNSSVAAAARRLTETSRTAQASSSSGLSGQIYLQRLKQNVTSA